MKKVLFVLLMVAVGATVFTGCKKDEDNDVSASLIGKWKLEKIEYIGVEEKYIDNNSYYVFKENNVFEMIGEGGGTGTYSVSADGKTVTLGSGEESDKAIIKSITSNSLVLYLESEQESQAENPDGTYGPIETTILKMEMTFKREN